jgi:hypothetical protein
METTHIRRNQMNLSGGRRKLGVCAIFAAALGALVLIGPVARAEATHTTGQYVEGVARCLDRGRITVNVPLLSPANPVGYNQRVAIRVHLAELTASGWITVASDVWKTAIVSNTGIGTNWTTLDGTSTEGATHVYGLKPGSSQNRIKYAVFTQYYWYADANHPASGGPISDWNPHEEFRGGGTYQTQQWDSCLQPGPNYIIKMIG